MPLDPILQEQAHDAIRSGRLPSRNPDRTLGGPGSGEACAVCGEQIRLHMTELEIQFSHDGAVSDPPRFRLHHQCFAAWEVERGAT
jgi:hypothetical protein